MYGFESFLCFFLSLSIIMEPIEIKNEFFQQGFLFVDLFMDFLFLLKKIFKMSLFWILLQNLVRHIYCIYKILLCSCHVLSKGPYTANRTHICMNFFCKSYDCILGFSQWGFDIWDTFSYWRESIVNFRFLNCFWIPSLLLVRRSTALNY